MEKNDIARKILFLSAQLRFSKVKYAKDKWKDIKREDKQIKELIFSFLCV